MTLGFLYSEYQGAFRVPVTQSEPIPQQILRMPEFKFHCPKCRGPISAGPEWEGQITGCPHCKEEIEVARPQTHRLAPAIHPASKVSELPTVHRPDSAPVERLWENDFFNFCCPHCRRRVRIQGILLQDEQVACPDCGSGIDPSKADDLAPESQALYRLPVSKLFFSYKGRVARFHFWLLGILPTLTLPAVAAILLQPGGEIRELNAQARTLFMLLWFLPVGLPVMVKRLHDRGKSGHLAWLLLLVLLPGLASSEVYPVLGMIGFVTQVIAPVFLMVTLGLFPGSPNVNRYGPPPSLIRYR